MAILTLLAFEFLGDPRGFLGDPGQGVVDLQQLGVVQDALEVGSRVVVRLFRNGLQIHISCEAQFPRER
eukprot:CAMPEP_0170184516 /NCGR_PEP_ID=MMETSP0040_2-20121228/33849_1 /TAXON_ID=641309 /ORGANISM="Lotharella oceanica, Strain CCMP622" /LENGTH=68 /DNA_ID=CAMNT_0010430603 /DNA_START=77 /DNA_END=280 /DNA_ORIENTATION=+